MKVRTGVVPLKGGVACRTLVVGLAVLNELRPKILKHCGDGHDRRLPKRAQRGLFHKGGLFDEEIDVGFVRRAHREFFHQMMELNRSDAAGNALPARLVLEEAEYLEQVVNRTGVLVAHQHDTGAEGNTLLYRLVDVQRQVHEVLSENAAGASSHMGELELFALFESLAMDVDNLL